MNSSFKFIQRKTPWETTSGLGVIGLASWFWFEIFGRCQKPNETLFPRPRRIRGSSSCAARAQVYDEGSEEWGGRVADGGWDWIWFRVRGVASLGGARVRL